MTDKSMNDIVNDSVREGEKMLRDMQDATRPDPNQNIEQQINERLKTAYELARVAIETEEGRKAIDFFYHVHLNSYPGFAAALISKQGKEKSPERLSSDSLRLNTDNYTVIVDTLKAHALAIVANAHSEMTDDQFNDFINEITPQYATALTNLITSKVNQARKEELENLRFQQDGHDHNKHEFIFSICPLCDRIEELDRLITLKEGMEE